MNQETFRSILMVGETVTVEFKRCGNGIEHDVYESVCAFLNRFGGDIFMGVLDDGTVIGVPEKAVPDMVKNFISVISNDSLFHPTVYIAPELIEFDGHMVIHVHVPPSSEVHSYKKVIYDRMDDADVKVTATSAIAAMYIRKQNVFTEKRIYPYAKIEDLRLDLLPRVRQAAANHAMGRHPWQDMDDMELLKSAGLYGLDVATGEKGFNLAAILLLGKDEVIQNVCPAYETDAIVRRVNLDRYDDREIVRTNLIESYDILMDFARKHLSDKFFLEGVDRVSLRDVLAREIVSNILMHREFISSYTAKFVIMRDRMYTENANRAVKDGLITPDNLEPVSKNPIIATFFRNIGRADRLGSGVRNLFKYSRFYSGSDPKLSEGDIFRIIVPLDDSFSYDYAVGRSDSAGVIHDGGCADYVINESYGRGNSGGAMVSLEQGMTQDMTQDVTQDMTQDTTRKEMYQQILAYCVTPRSKQEILAFCGHRSKKRFTQYYIAPLLESGQLGMTIPDKPRSGNQKYVTIRSGKSN